MRGFAQTIAVGEEDSNVFDNKQENVIAEYLYFSVS
jgi:hypothetical protein